MAYHTGGEKKTLHLYLPEGIDAEISKSIGLDDVNENKKTKQAFLICIWRIAVIKYHPCPEQANKQDI